MLALTLTNKPGQRAVLFSPPGGDCDDPDRIRVEVEVQQGKVKLFITAPRNVRVLREELLEPREAPS